MEGDEQPGLPSDQEGNRRRTHRLTSSPCSSSIDCLDCLFASPSRLTPGLPVPDGCGDRQIRQQIGITQWRSAPSPLICLILAVILPRQNVVGSCHELSCCSESGCWRAIQMVPDGDQEVSTSSSTAAAAIAGAALPPRPVSFKRTAVWHQMKHRRFRAGGTKKMAVASSPAQAVGEATTAAAAMRAPTESDRDDEKGHVWGSWKSEDGSMHCGYSSNRGRRQTMEDFYDIKASKTDAKRINVFGVFDGHGGSCAAKYLKEHLFENLLKHPAFITDTKLAISESYKETDADFLAAETTICRDSGSTASAAIFVGNHLYVANVGDSRAVISKAGKAIALSDDHKPDRSDERERIENAGGVVTFSGTWRVGGVLAMSRAFGDRLLKQFVVAEPEIQEQEIDDELEFLILASDGLWDVVPNEHAVAFVKEVVGPEAAARKLTEIAYRRGSRDNITCIVVEFHRDSVGIGSPPLSGQI
ncbi:probable protein phosphatase 2C 7 [Lolium rigidum]|uniref:probable protein phosphatase 2C 7 n=1 Tax=Lolium rigidum TaxID=89674 RepID=UPI001F5DFFE3|nr:probable protein phosphatase 2C 7 [Lolium rigidum]